MPNWEVDVKVSITANDMASAVKVLQERIEQSDAHHRNDAIVKEITAKPEKKR
jgi:hypothetical protein